MKKLFWVLAIIGMGIVGHFDRPELHHPDDISKEDKREHLAAYTTVDEYQHVSLIASESKKGRGK